MSDQDSSFKYIKGLDVLRAFAVILVLLWHYLPSEQLTTISGALKQILPTGVFGVNLFFVLSGFLITSILLKARSENDDKPAIIKNFIMRRILRIFPVYYLLLILLSFLNYPIEKGHLIYFYTYTANILFFKLGRWGELGHLWSLSVEEQFYLIWPWVLILTPKKHLKNCICLFICIGAISSFIVSRKYDLSYGSPYFTLTPLCFDAFGIGSIYALFRSAKNTEGWATVTKIYSVGLIVSLIAVLYWTFVPFFHKTVHFIFYIKNCPQYYSFMASGYCNRKQNGLLNIY